MIGRLLFSAGALTLLSAPVEARSKAAEYVIDQEITAACSGAGTIAPEAVIERDLTGDGRDDLVISHEGISCQGGGRSAFCGAQICSVNFYVREGALLKLNHEMLGGGVRVGDGAVPAIHMYAHGGGEGQVKWNGETFR